MIEKKYYTTVGLEIHAELNTKSKMFCTCINEPHQPSPNINICSVCTAQPGTLPLPNKEAIKKVIEVGFAVGGNIAEFSEFDRKNYFYPDIPKAYQISQYKYPFVTGGSLAGVDITRIHLEEDTGTNEHKGSYSLVDYNRAGVPLMELVTEPCIHDSATAIKFGQELQLLLRYLDVSSANMEKGEMRVEVNVSISDDPEKLGTKVEVKNINSFNIAGRAIDYEVSRMKALMEEGRGHEIVQETRGWDDAKQSTYSQRKKENSDDYRYFPEPDIPKITVSKLFNLEEIRANVKMTPLQKREFFDAEYGIKLEDREIFIADRDLCVFFENVMGGLEKATAQLVSNYITSDIIGIAKAESLSFAEIFENLSVESMQELMNMNKGEELNSRSTKDILKILCTKGGSPRAIANEGGMIQKNDPEALRTLINELIAPETEKIAEYKAGKETLLMYFIGLCMKATKGSANPEKIKEIVLEIINK